MGVVGIKFLAVLFLIKGKRLFLILIIKSVCKWNYFGFTACTSKLIRPYLLIFFLRKKIPLSNICGIIIITIILCVFTYLNPGRGGEHIKRLRTVVFSYVFCYEQSCSILSRDKKNLIQMLTWEKISYTNPPFHISI